jgi:thiamine-phosphate pyrophosphorylase
MLLRSGQVIGPLFPLPEGAITHSTQEDTHMTETDQPQIYLVTPPAFDPDPFAQQLAAVLDQTPVACLRLALATQDVDSLSRAADQIREIAHSRDIPLVIEAHVQLVEGLGLDGVHLTDASRSVRATRKTLGADAIIGAFCGISNHDGIGAGEAGADYIGFGPVGATVLGDGSQADYDLFAWWSEMIELPVVAEGALTPELVALLAPVTDFFAIGQEIWTKDDPAAALLALIQPLR